MVFSSLIFLYAFFPLCLLAYTLCRTLRAKNICLLVFSLLVYAWGEPVYVLLLAVMALFDWYFALRVQRAREENGNAKKFVVLTCIVNLGLIGFFKYAGMICSVFGAVPAFVQKIALPLGISFYTFQLLSYVVDVYRGDAEAQEKYWQVLLYAALFHQCVAGPIVRYKTVAEELFAGRDEHSDRASGEENGTGQRLRFAGGQAVAHRRRHRLRRAAFGESVCSLRCPGAWSLGRRDRVCVPDLF